MLKDAQKQRDAAGTGDQFAEARQSYETTITDLREEIATLKVSLAFVSSEPVSHR